MDFSTRLAVGTTGLCVFLHQVPVALLCCAVLFFTQQCRAFARKPAHLLARTLDKSGCSVLPRVLLSIITEYAGVEDDVYLLCADEGVKILAGSGKPGCSDGIGPLASFQSPGNCPLVIGSMFSARAWVLSLQLA